MQKKLVQKRGFIKRETQIMETKVVYKSTLFGREHEISIPFENLSRNKDSYLLNRKNFYIPVIALGFLSFVTFTWRNDKDFQNDLGGYQWIIWGFLFVISTTVYLLSIENLWRIRTQYNTYLFFFKSIPNKKAVDDFIEFLFEIRDKYLKETYFHKPNKSMSFETQINNLRWLRKNEVISASEFKNGMRELEVVFNQEQKKIGFN